MKKTISTLLMLLLIVLAINTAIYAEFLGDAEVTPLQVETLKDQEFEVQVSVNCIHNDGETAYIVTKIDYDKSILEYCGVTKFEGREVNADFFNETGRIITDGYASEGEDIRLFIIKFKVLNTDEIPNLTTIEIGNIATDGMEDQKYTNLGTISVNVNILDGLKPSPSPSSAPTENPTQSPEPSATPGPAASPEPSATPTSAVDSEPSYNPVEKPEVQPNIQENPDNSSSPSMSATTGTSVQMPTARVNATPVAPKTGANHSNIKIMITLSILVILAIILVKKLKES